MGSLKPERAACAAAKALTPMLVTFDKSSTDKERISSAFGGETEVAAIRRD